MQSQAPTLLAEGDSIDITFMTLVPMPPVGA
jgi:hypothetical protein